MPNIRCRICNAPLTRGTYRNIWRRNFLVGRECRSHEICLQHLQARLRAIEPIAIQMGNACFNVAQQQGLVIGKDYAELFTGLYQQWDSARRIYA